MEDEKTILLQGVVGSTAYGLAHPNSDIDRLGTFLYPIVKDLGLRKPDETISSVNPDICLHVLSKFMKLCTSANPTAMELLWLEDYEILHPAGKSLIALRETFLTRRIYETYGGYVLQQLKRLKERGDFGSDLKARQAKHGRHCARLLIQGRIALQERRIKIRLDEDEVDWVTHMGATAAIFPDKFEEEIMDLLADFDKIETDLPEEVNMDLVEEVYIDIRMKTAL